MMCKAQLVHVHLIMLLQQLTGGGGGGGEGGGGCNAGTTQLWFRLCFCMTAVDDWHMSWLALSLMLYDLLCFTSC